ncbi:ABC transporter permease [Poseidonocella sp. HB161398]|uniref:ABC transporter permease n=1 Tax=Poseidonocella sp. HB161398 TaxID=2320855 RepID=UPI0011082969|nr:ABC transporter permease [Poseidonocella sp. HB161398]
MTVNTTDTPPMPRLGIDARALFRRFGLAAALLAMAAVFAALSDVFLTAQNLRNLLLQAAPLAAVAFGQAFVVLNGDLDLSVGSAVGLCSVVMASVMAAQGVWPGIAAGLGAGLLLGLANAAAVTWLRVMPFIATLAMMSIAQGAALMLSHGTPVVGLPAGFADFGFARVLGLPAPFLLAAALGLGAALFLAFTVPGRDVYAVGGNAAAARLAGIPVPAIRVMSFAICGLSAAVAALILTARVSSGQPTLGGALALQSVAAVVLGGVSLFGGRGSIAGVAVGVAFVTVLGNGLNLLNVSSYAQMVAIGLALIAAVALDRLLADARG